MTGTAVDLIPIVIVPIVALAFWLTVMYHAASHPRWGRRTPADAVPAPGSVPAQRLSRPAPAVPGPRPGTSAVEVTLERARADGTRR
jgi:hypothetical protein